jgi:phosphoribosylamine--glycine ligase
MDRFIRPTVAAFAAKGMPYMGVLYLGLMITRDGPKLVEYNCRFGDPECQVLMPRLDSELLALLLAARRGKLDKTEVRWKADAALTVVMASRGYPGSYEKGQVITGLDKAAALPGITLFHAGTERRGTDIVAVGGRVLNVTATAPTIAQAQKRAYEAAALIHWNGAFCRKDIGWRALNKCAPSVATWSDPPTLRCDTSPFRGATRRRGRLS